VISEILKWAVRTLEKRRLCLRKFQ